MIPLGVTTQRPNCHLSQQKSKQQEGMPPTALPTPSSACPQKALKAGQRHPEACLTLSAGPSASLHSLWPPQASLLPAWPEAQTQLFHLQIAS